MTTFLYISDEYRARFVKSVRYLNSIVSVARNLLTLAMVMKDFPFVSTLRRFLEYFTKCIFSTSYLYSPVVHIIQI